MNIWSFDICNSILPWRFSSFARGGGERERETEREREKGLRGLGFRVAVVLEPDARNLSQKSLGAKQ